MLLLTTLGICILKARVAASVSLLGLDSSFLESVAQSVENAISGNKKALTYGSTGNVYGYIDDWWYTAGNQILIQSETCASISDNIRPYTDDWNNASYECINGNQLYRMRLRSYSLWFLYDNIESSNTNEDLYIQTEHLIWSGYFQSEKTTYEYELANGDIIYGYRLGYGYDCTCVMNDLFVTNSPNTGFAASASSYTLTDELYSIEPGYSAIFVSYWIDTTDCTQVIYDHESIFDIIAINLFTETTESPTNKPSNSPTSSPSYMPSHSPTTTLECSPIAIDWTSSITINDANVDISWESGTSLLNFNVFLKDYIQDATYVIDFISYSGDIDNPTNCENRNSNSFNNKQFNQYWNTSLQPWYDDKAIGTSTYLIYPPSTDNWDISGVFSDRLTEECGSIIYNGTFSINSLLNCKDKSSTINSVSVSTNETTNLIELNGILYVTIVAPMDMYDESEGYHTYELLTKPFSITIPYIVTSTNVNNLASINDFMVTIVSISNNVNNNYQVSIKLYSYSGEFYLAFPKVSKITNNNNNDINISNIYFVDNITNCFNNDVTDCQQLWTMEFSDNLGCPTDYSGIYSLEWNVLTCENNNNDNDISECIVSSTKVASSLEISYNVDWCENALYSLEISTETQISNNSDYSFYLNEEKRIFDIGDRIYLSISANIDDSDIDLFNVSLYNVWICAVNGSMSLPDYNENTGIGGCLTDDSNLIEYGPYLIVNSGEIVDNNDFSVKFENKEYNDEARYSILAPNFGDNAGTLYIHNQVEIDLLYEKNIGTRNGRVLLADDTVLNYLNEFKHDIASINYLDLTIINPDIDNNNNSSNENSVITRIAVISGSILGVAVILGICWFLAKKWKRSKYRPDNENGMPPPAPSAPTLDDDESGNVIDSFIQMSERPSNINNDAVPVCSICQSNNARIVTVPCGHFIACNDCNGGNLLDQLNSTCPLCRTHVTSLLSVYT